MNKFIKILYILIILSLIFSCKNEGAVTPKAKNGVIDLKNCYFSKNGNIKLDGEWEFYWKEFLTYEQIKEKKEPTCYIKVPGNWNKEKFENIEIDDLGHATYRVKILLSEGEKNLAINMPNANTSLEAYIDNTLMQIQGKIGIKKTQSNPAFKPGIFEYKTEKKSLDLIIHVSNYHYSKGGLRKSIEIGQVNNIKKISHYNTLLEFFLCGSILIMAFYHFFLYVLRKEYKATLFLSIYCLLVAIRILITGEKFLHIYTNLNFTLLVKAEYTTYYMGFLIFVLFVYNLFPKDISKEFVDVFTIVASIFCIIVIVSPIYYFTNTLKFYNSISVPTGIYIYYALTKAIIKKRAGALVFLFGYTSIFIAAINDVLYHQEIIYTADLVPIGLFFLIFSQAGSISIQLSKTFDKVENLSSELKIKISDLEKANKKTKLSEEKYKLLVEGTNDIIFTLDENWNFISVNKSIQRHLNINSESIVSHSFLDILYEDIDRDNVNREFVIEKLELLSAEKNQIYFKTNFKSPISSEPREMAVTLEYIKLEGKHEILGKLSRIMEDELLKYFQSETQNFAIDNYLIICADISQRLTRNVEKYIDKKEIKFIQLALREMLINSIEHGNLNITFEEKNKAMLNDNYFEFISNRQRDPDYKNKKISIKYALDENELIYTITDEGNGFNHQKFTQGQIIDVNNEMISHGRGIAMTLKVFDNVVYNDKGNQVTLIKTIKK